MRMRLIILTLATCLVTTLTACGPQPGGGGSTPAPYNPVPTTCPFEDTVMLAGTSIMRGAAGYVEVPNKDTFNAAQGGSGYVVYSADKPTVASRVLQWITQCGAPDVLVIDGGLNDFNSWPLPVGANQVQAAVQELDEILAGANINVVWMTTSPIPFGSSKNWFYPERQAYNEWLRTTSLQGELLDCIPAIEDPAHPDYLAPKYWQPIDGAGTPDPIGHPNPAGYEALGNCIEGYLTATMTALE